MLMPLIIKVPVWKRTYDILFSLSLKMGLTKVGRLASGTANKAMV